MSNQNLYPFFDNYLWGTDLLPQFFFNLCGGTLGPAATTGLLYQPRMIGEGDCGEIGGIKISRGNGSTRRKPCPAPLCPSQIPHDWTRIWTRAAATELRRTILFQTNSIWILKSSDDRVSHSELLGFWTSSIIRYCRNYRRHNVSETGSFSVSETLRLLVSRVPDCARSKKIRYNSEQFNLVRVFLCQEI
jgi:hypothetical protein